MTNNAKLNRGGVFQSEENHELPPSENKNWTLVNWCEFDKFAIRSYCAIHNESEEKNLGDITKVDEKNLDDFNFMTWGFPCTDISTAGKQKGFLDENGEKTRSGMYYEGIRILKYKKPAVSIIENVKNLTSKKFQNEFNMVLSDLDEAGYNSYWKVLNAKDYGIPQNRERVFIVSIRKDLDNGQFKFPEKLNIRISLQDILEDEVDEKYYINTEKARKLIDNLIESGKLPKSRAEQSRTDIALTDLSIGQITKKSPTVLPQNTEASRIENQKVPVLLKGMGSKEFEPEIEQRNIACALCARDYKGLNNYGLNGVLECQKKS